MNDWVEFTDNSDFHHISKKKVFYVDQSLLPDSDVRWTAILSFSLLDDAENVEHTKYAILQKSRSHLAFNMELKTKKNKQ